MVLGPKSAAICLECAQLCVGIVAEHTNEVGADDAIVAQPLVSGSSILLHFRRHTMGLNVGELYATAGIDFTAVVDTPGGEGVRIDVSFDDDVPLADISLATLFSHVLPLQEGTGKSLSTVSEHQTRPLVIRFISIPNQS